ncbi:MAG: biotin--[acetyl-CoA-carboxylase] ligase [Prevotella sp.]|nr:biotin--[acetyl-CoA-carboxylase] ligase [Prevotella sp.]
MNARIIYIEEVDSTNNYLRGFEPGDSEDVTFVWTDFQTAGRGCGTNTWESEAGKNLTFSFLVCPHNVSAREQFILSMASALALKRVLDRYAEGITIKWPNDIYWHDRKICGTLIEATLSGQLVKTCIVGTGLNVNQWEFRSDAPNPVSLFQILGHEVDREQLLREVVDETLLMLEEVEDGHYESLRAEYRSALYRKDEVHDYRLPDGQELKLVLSDVEDDGHLLMNYADSSGELRFGFKEIQFII